MVWQKDDKPLTDFDWTVIGRRCRRLIIPLPNDKAGLHRLSHLLAGLAESLHQAAALNPQSRSAILEAGFLFRQANERFRLLRDEWEAEYSAGKLEQSGDGKRTKTSEKSDKALRVVGESN